MQLAVTLLSALVWTACLDDRQGAVPATTRMDAVDTTDNADTADTAITDTAITDTADTADPPDTADTADTADISAPDPCVGPLRISPRRGPAAGGTVVVAEGMEFYIGALTWMMKIGDAKATEMDYNIVGPPPLPCRISFVTEPSQPGTFDVQIYYGWGEPSAYDADFPRHGIAGQFTYE
jgi:hypothetical protein